MFNGFQEQGERKQGAMGKAVVTVRARNDGLNSVPSRNGKEGAYLKDIGKVFDCL